MSGTNTVSPAVESAKYLASRDSEDNIVTLANGTRVKIVPVSATLIDEVVSRVKNPPIPMWHNPDKDRDEPNPSDPQYLVDIADNERKRGVAAMDAMVMFGIELIDGIPESDKWLKKLKLLEKTGNINLDAYDINDDIDAEFLYKRYILSDANLLTMISKVSGMTEDVERAERSFPSD